VITRADGSRGPSAPAARHPPAPRQPDRSGSMPKIIAAGPSSGSAAVEPGPAREQGIACGLRPSPLAAVGEVDQQDAFLRHEPHQEGRCRIIEKMLSVVSSASSASITPTIDSRQRGHDGDGQEEAAELRSQHQVDEEIHGEQQRTDDRRRSLPAARGIWRATSISGSPAGNS